MPKNGKHKFTLKQDREAREISKSYQKKGFTKKESDRIGYSTVNKLRNR